MTNLKWYETRCFALYDVDAGVVHNPIGGEDKSALKALAAQGWEDDPTSANADGWIYVRREIELQSKTFKRLRDLEGKDAAVQTALNRLAERATSLSQESSLSS